MRLFPRVLRLERQDEGDAICPHCDHPLSTVWYQEMGGFAGKRYVYFCSSCRKVLGISHRKGFFMG